ncbi:MAG: L,D-transpeptidase family protein [Ignavibacteria bacterium]
MLQISKKNRVILSFLGILLITGYYAFSSGYEFKSLNESLFESKKSNDEIKDNSEVDYTVLIDSAQEKSNSQKVVFKIESFEEADRRIEDYLRDVFPLISNHAVEDIIANKIVNKFLVNDTLGIVEFYANFYVPNYYFEQNPNLLWELNIPEFQSRIYQVYGVDTLLIDIWPNVVGKPSTKTYTGHYQAFRIRNWPFWKDPEASDSVRPTPPGPNNPLGLFVVHYDENSLRYFHGTNKSYLLKNEYRALSHGCVRNENENIGRMKKFILKKIIKSEDLSSWLDSKKTMIYEFTDEDKFPVRIIYKTFDISRDVRGDYVIFFKDVYNYSNNGRLGKFDDPSLITFTSIENILSEFKKEYPSYQIPDEKIIPILENLITNHEDYQKYYFDDLVAEQINN